MRPLELAVSACAAANVCACGFAHAAHSVSLGCCLSRAFISLHVNLCWSLLKHKNILTMSASAHMHTRARAHFARTFLIQWDAPASSGARCLCPINNLASSPVPLSQGSRTQTLGNAPYVFVILCPVWGWLSWRKGVWPGRLASPRFLVFAT